jgi:uncharacterized protein YodC (DUF2158 family)
MDDLKAGDVVILKSGGHPLTVAEVHDHSVECIWLGEEGQLFRETLPAITLERAELEEDDKEEDDADAEANGEDDDEDEDNETRAVA